MSNKKVIYTNANEAELKRVWEEFENSGRFVKRTGPNELTIYAFAQKDQKKRGDEEKRPQRVTKQERETGYIPRD